MIRKATIEDLDTILLLIDEGRRKMIAEGNVNQWSGGCPSREMLVKDIAQGVSHLVVIDGKPVATFVLIEGPDPTYARIYDGEWQNDNPYYVIHRVASVAGVHGIMRAVLDYAFTQTGTIRIDTHEENLTMRALLAKYGFSYCGVILLENGDPRLAYQKTI
ncbi:MAG: GNAT family N-acetyltransferase [Bacteroidaceae bacterium]|nr:GNAT family N-acetyltransferase [Bacteroidaceae bacterium]